uniref:Tandem C2 domains, nuclear n=1 Tax=Pavo cristatus TaxID=9049 RepID=A0A8C9EN67_PAVCR
QNVKEGKENSKGFFLLVEHALSMAQESQAVPASKPTIVEQPPLSSVSVKRQVGCSEDYLLSKLPLDGQEVPFVVPPFKLAYVQPKSLPTTSHESARASFGDRKAELCGVYQWPRYDVYNPFYLEHHVSPDQIRRFQAKSDNRKLYGSGENCTLFCLSPFSKGHVLLFFPLQRYDSVSSVPSSTSSRKDSHGSNRSLGDELCIILGQCRRPYVSKLSESWWLCKGLSWPSGCGENPRIYVKGILTLPKPVQFKSSAKEGCNDIEFMETFVFAIKLQSVQTVRLVFKIQMQTPRKRTIGECSLSLRELSSEDCSILPSSCLLFLYFSLLAVLNNFSNIHKVIMWSDFESPTVKLDFCVTSGKLHFVSFFSLQVWISSDSNSSEAVEQWEDTIANPEKVVIKWYSVGPS